MQPPPGASVPPAFVDLYTAEEWAAFASRLNSILDWSHAPLCPCGFLLIFYCCCLLTCLDCRSASVRKLLAKENQRLREQAVEWVFIPASLTITLRWEPLTRPAWEAAHPQRRQITREPPQRPSVDARGMTIRVRPASTSPVLEPVCPSSPSFGSGSSAPGPAVQMHLMPVPSAPPPPPYQSAIGQEEGATNGMGAQTLSPSTCTDGLTFADCSSAPEKQL